jgi:hypothetical protein
VGSGSGSGTARRLSYSRGAEAGPCNGPNEWECDAVVRRLRRGDSGIGSGGVAYSPSSGATSRSAGWPPCPHQGAMRDRRCGAPDLARSSAGPPYPSVARPAQGEAAELARTQGASVR